MDKEKVVEMKDKSINFMKTSNLLGIIGAVLVIIGVFLPLIKIKVWFVSESVSYIKGDGIFLLILSVITLVMIFADLIAKKFEAASNILSKVSNPKLTLIPTVISLIFMIRMIIEYGEYSDYASYQIGFYVIWLGLILSALYGIFYKKPENQ